MLNVLWLVTMAYFTGITEMINPKLYNLYIQKYMNGGFSEMEAQVKTIKKLSQSFDINFWEVSYNG